MDKNKIIGSLCTIIISLVVYIFLSLNATVQETKDSLISLENKIILNEFADSIGVDNMWKEINHLKELHDEE